jgi:hypothetical protein
MKVEGETAYEPDILVLMERFEEVLGRDKKVYRQATVIKDRSALIDGKIFINPTFNDFAPAIDDMLANPSKYQPKEQDSTGLFYTEEDKRAYIRQKEIILEKISNELFKAWPSSGAADKKRRIEASEQVFNTNSWEEIKQKGLDELTAGLKSLKIIVQDELAKQYPDKVKTVKVPQARKGGRKHVK